MDISRYLGIGIVMIVPAFVGSGALWHFLHSWIAVFIWIIVMAFLYGRIVPEKLAGNANRSL